MPLVRAYLALGSNLGDRLAQMQAALERLTQQPALKVVQVSPVYENRAVGMGEVDDFLNAIAAVDTSLGPLDLLDRCLTVESELGRVRSGQWAPRTIDLDVIAYGEASIDHERLQLPHPRIEERDFVLHPLHALAPELRIRGQRVADLASILSMDELTLRSCELRLPSVD
ncbi:MAG: 2-amino-4-hydroxy-6-hydroxymethyldihydropteridine diphosphokinase [Puniceicoccaceae bacterium]|nr:2-amino-4-hydroxy-6-hydroxymethyldihydropteridine diphosphokinase [Puniceicoccaceae bacterium]|tara:strand:+ start:3652 stop:4161 length:510 start_codon:yes stop_codon:yes gene_type:complete